MWFLLRLRQQQYRQSQNRFRRQRQLRRRHYQNESLHSGGCRHCCLAMGMLKVYCRYRRHLDHYRKFARNHLQNRHFFRLHWLSLLRKHYPHRRHRQRMLLLKKQNCCHRFLTRHLINLRLQRQP